MKHDRLAIFFLGINAPSPLWRAIPNCS